MKTKIILAIATVGLMLSLQTLAQDTQGKPHQQKTQKSVIISNNGDNGEKTVLEVSDGKILLNGKPVDFDSLRYEGDSIPGFGVDSILVWNSVDSSVDAMPLVVSTMPRVVKAGKAQIVSKAFLGVVTESNDAGAKITSVTKESAAEKAGLKEGDIITKVNDVAIKTPNDLHNTIGKFKPDDEVNITYLRGNATEKTVTVKLDKSKEMQAFLWNDRNFNFNFPRGFNFPNNDNFNNNLYFQFNSKPRLGLQVQDLEDGTGVKVTNVNENSPADKAGLKEDDIITQINGSDIKNVDDVREKIKGLKEGDTYQILYKRNGTTKNAEIKISKKLKTADL